MRCRRSVQLASYEPRMRSRIHTRQLRVATTRSDRRIRATGTNNEGRVVGGRDSCGCMAGFPRRWCVVFLLSDRGYGDSQKVEHSQVLLTDNVCDFFGAHAVLAELD